MGLSKRTRFEVFKRDNFTCQYCGGRAPDVVLEADHIHPRSKGGRDSMDNLRTACRACNAGKSDVLLVLPVAKVCDLVGGPLAGQKLPLASIYPLLWVVRKTDGTFEWYEDAWRWDEDEGDLDPIYPRIKLGPPWHRGSDKRKGLFFDERDWPQLVGFYWHWQPNAPTLDWHTLQDFIVELTS